QAEGWIAGTSPAMTMDERLERVAYSAAQFPYMIGIIPAKARKRGQLLRSGRVQPASAMAERRGKTRRSKMARSVMDSLQMQAWMPMRFFSPSGEKPARASNS